MSEKTVLVCPKCGKCQGFRTFGLLFVIPAVNCDRCGTKIRYKLKSMQINGILLGILVGCMGKATTDLHVTELIVITVFATYTIQRFIDVWSGMEIVPPSEL